MDSKLILFNLLGFGKCQTLWIYRSKGHVTGGVRNFRSGVGWGVTRLRAPAVQWSSEKIIEKGKGIHLWHQILLPYDFPFCKQCNSLYIYTETSIDFFFRVGMQISLVNDSLNFQIKVNYVRNSRLCGRHFNRI